MRFFVFIAALGAVIEIAGTAAGQDATQVRIVTSAKNPGVARIETEWRRVQYTITGEDGSQLPYRKFSVDPTRILIKGRGIATLEVALLDDDRRPIKTVVEKVQLQPTDHEVALTALERRVAKSLRKIPLDQRGYLLSVLQGVLTNLAHNAYASEGEARQVLRSQQIHAGKLWAHAWSELFAGLEECTKSLAVDGGLSTDEAREMYAAALRGAKAER